MKPQKIKEYPAIMRDDQATGDRDKQSRKLSAKGRKKSLNLASYHSEACSNFTPYYTESKRSIARFSVIEKATKTGRKKRARRKNTRQYIEGCPGEYHSLKVKPVKRLAFAYIQFPCPAGADKENYTFRFPKSGQEFSIEEMDKDKALSTIRSKFLKWCNQRGFETGDKFSLTLRDGAFHFVVERSPDMRPAKPTKSVTSL